MICVRMRMMNDMMLWWLRWLDNVGKTRVHEWKEFSYLGYFNAHTVTGWENASLEETPKILHEDFSFNSVNLRKFLPRSETNYSFFSFFFTKRRHEHENLSCRLFCLAHDCPHGGLGRRERIRWLVGSHILSRGFKDQYVFTATWLESAEKEWIPRKTGRQYVYNHAVE
jgi:hypothetical protein